MADSPYKRAIINRAVMKFTEGTTAAARTLFDDIDTTYFSDPFTNVPSTRKDILVACVKYEEVLKRVLIDLKPKFARYYADLGHEIKINKEIADWSYMFELPSDFLWFIEQVEETDKSQKYESVIKYFKSYAHIVSGTDDQTYYCSTAHTSASATKPITGASYATYWTLYDEDDFDIDWITGKAYKASETGRLLLTNNYSNSPSTTVDTEYDSAYIEYIPYTQAGINDEPQYYDEYFSEAFAILLGSELAIVMGKDYDRHIKLIGEYENIAKPNFFENEVEKENIPERKPIWENSKNLTLP